MTLIYMVSKGSILDYAKIYGLNSNLFLSYVTFEKSNKKLHDYVNRRGEFS